MRLLGVFLLGVSANLLVGCVSLDLEKCGERLCSPGLVCGPDELTCVLQEQIDVCVGEAAGMSCSYASVPDGFCSSGVCIGALTAPANVAATDGESVDSVTVTWEPVTGATGYRVFRDGVAIDDVTTSSYDDVGASPGAAPSAPVLTATAGTYTDRVELAWSDAATPPGTTHTYLVAALAADMVGPSSAPDTGNRAAYPIITYELAMDGGAFAMLGNVTTYIDATAPAGSYTATVTASDGTKGAIALSVTTPTAVAGASRGYSVRAVSEAGAGAVASNAGHRNAGAFAGYQWQRSTTGPDTGFTDLAGATAATHVDTTAPLHVPCWYRSVLAGANSDPGYPVADAGWRVPSDTPRAGALYMDYAPRVLAAAGGVLYMGGFFTYVGQETGRFVALDSNGDPDLSRPMFDGPVEDAASDGAGGYYVAGTFSHVGSASRSYLAHIDAAGVLDTAFDPGIINGQVSSVAVASGRVYIAGSFSTIGGQSRDRLASLDATTGAVTAWNPSPDSFISDFVVSGGVVYVAGSFSTIGGAAREGIAAIDATTGVATAWDAKVTGSFVSLKSLAVTTDTVYFSGSYDQVGGQARDYFAAVDTATGALQSWAPALDGPAQTMAVDGTTLYVGGQFSCLGAFTYPDTCAGTMRRRAAAFDTSTGQMTAWDPRLVGSGSVWSIAVSGSTVYLGGDFTSANGVPRRNAAAVSATTGDVTSWDAPVSSTVNTISVSGNKVFVGGYFRSAGGDVRNHLAAIDIATGQLSSWNPGIEVSSGTGVSALAVAGTTLYVGGTFDRIGGQTRHAAAAVDVSTGAIKAWNPDVVGTVFALAVTGTSVYVGGSFTTVGGQTRKLLASVDATSGALSSFDGNLSPIGSVYALVVNGGTLYAGGTFVDAGGVSRNRLAAFDVASGALTAWNPNADRAVNTLAASGNTIYAGGLFASIGGTSRSRIAAIDGTTGATTAWNPSASLPPPDPPPGPFDPPAPEAEVTRLSIYGSAVYVGGRFNAIGSKLRTNAAALDLATGAASDWAPSGTTDVYGVLPTQNATFVANGANPIRAFDP